MWPLHLLRAELSLLLGLLLLASPPSQGEIFASLGSSAVLPCNTTSHRPVTTVIWFRGSSTDPFYSLDRRDGGSKHWTSQAWRDRATFRFEPPSSALHLGRLEEGDGGLFRCKVDYSQAPTSVSTVRLVLLVPPSQPVIVNSRGQLFEPGGLVGPLEEGGAASLHCRTGGGQPPPSLVWRKDGKTLNSTSEVSVEPATLHTVTSSTLTLTNLTRADQGSVVECLAQSLATQPDPLRTEVTLSILLPPLSCSLLPPSPAPLPSGSPATFTCSAPGSSPDTLYRWRLEGPGWSRPLSSSPVLTLTIDTRMHNASLSCTASNPLLPEQALVASTSLRVHFLPQVTLGLGSSISGAVREGEDIYLECGVEARPEVLDVHYTHQGERLDVSQPGRTLVSRGILVLQNITRQDAGEYVCVATNRLGEGRSPPLHIQVLFAPICAAPPRLYGLSVGDQAEVPCTVLANPTHDLVFHWFFNTTSEFKDFINLPSTPGPTNSSQIVTFLARGSRDYGMLQCFASNSVGHQILPCTSSIIPSGPPDPPVNCSAGEPHPFKVSISCLPGYNGGLDQRFTAELYTSGEYESLQTTVTNSHPSFTVYNLQPGTRYWVKLHSSNAKGRSGEVRMKATTVKETFRLPLLPPDQGGDFLEDGGGVPYQTSSPGLLEQTVFILLASLACLAFIVVLGLLLCKFQVGPGGLGGVVTVTSGTSPLSARELVEISLHQEDTSLH